MKTTLAVMTLFAAVGCSGTAIDHPPIAKPYAATDLVASSDVSGGLPAPYEGFAPYGYDFVRLYGDGSLYAGQARAVTKHTLDADALAALVASLRLDELSSYQSSYNSDPQLADAATSSFGGLYDKSYEIGCYPEYTACPKSLQSAVAALAAAARAPGGVAVVAKAIDIEIVNDNETLGAQPAWPVAAVSLALDKVVKKIVTVTDAATLTAVTTAIDSARADGDTSAAFVSGGIVYRVDYAIDLP
jgi:hypothetical protein